MRRRAFTIVEVLVVMVILGLIGGAIMAFFPTSAKLFQRGGAEAQAQNAASYAMKQIAPEVLESMNMNVVVRDAGTGDVRLELSLPAKAVDGTTGENLVVYPQTVGKEIAFYRSDASGGLNATGNYFWRAEKIGGTWTPIRAVTTGIASFTIPTVNTTLPKGMLVVVTSLGAQGSRRADVTCKEYLVLRNS